MSIVTNPILEICSDNNVQVFKYLNHLELARCASVCKNWLSFVTQDKFWKLGCVPTNSNFKQTLNKFAVASYDALAKKYKEFLQGICSEGRFQCVFPFNQNCIVGVDFGYGKNARWNSPMPERYFGCIFMREVPAGDEEELSGMFLCGEELFQIGDNQNYTILDLKLPEKKGARELAAKIRELGIQRAEELKTNAIKEKVAHPILDDSFLKLTGLFSFYHRIND